jgi:hypothetical protein
MSFFFFSLSFSFSFFWHRDAHSCANLHDTRTFALRCAAAISHWPENGLNRMIARHLGVLINDINIISARIDLVRRGFQKRAARKYRVARMHD